MPHPEPDLAIVKPERRASAHSDAAFLLIQVADMLLQFDRRARASRIGAWATVGTLSSLAVLLVAAPALAQAEGAAQPDQAIEVAIGLGYGQPLGRYGQTTAFKTGMSLDYWITGQVPVSLELGYRFDRHLVIGFAGQYGFGFVNQDHTVPCNNGVSCSASVTRIGLEATWNLLPKVRLGPWIGLGVGYEWFTTEQSGRINAVATARGPEYAALRGGADIAIGRELNVGPFFNLSFGRYENEIFSGDSLTGTPPTFTQTAIHEWLVVGTRGTYDFRL